MTPTTSPSDGREEPSTQLPVKYARWGGFAALLGPLLVLAANIYQLWVTQTYGGGVTGPSAEALLAAATTTAHIAFGGIRLAGATLLVFGLIALYAYQVEEAGTLGVVGFVGSMVGTVLLAAVAWFNTVLIPVLAEEVPAFLEGVRTGEFGVLLGLGVQGPIFIQAIGWAIFGVATYRAEVFPRRGAVVLIIGALLLFVPVQGIPVVFQLAVAWLGFLVVTGRVKPGYRAATVGTPSTSDPS